MRQLPGGCSGREEVTSTSTAEDRALDWRCCSIANVALRRDYLTNVLLLQALLVHPLSSDSLVKKEKTTVQSVLAEPTWL